MWKLFKDKKEKPLEPITELDILARKLMDIVGDKYEFLNIYGKYRSRYTDMIYVNPELHDFKKKIRSIADIHNLTIEEATDYLISKFNIKLMEHNEERAKTRKEALEEIALNKFKAERNKS